MSLPNMIQELSNDGCTDVEALEAAADLMKIERLKEQFWGMLDEIELNNIISETKNIDRPTNKLPALLSHLTKREKECFLLHVVEQQTFKNIAERLNITRSSVQVYITRARKKVKRLQER